ncbi:alpha/beta hydrolase [Sphingosinicella rhizophila]|uniref:Alpha/beta hydrolase-fold protein n=1 Tax=Sphingosinicella rhizophila TaxID=3050082 RepID=A0ABU3Q9W0_9SPHN|nr:alpha/beta hydrolase-fold protein [Sphingosinicella sp. GR2756]MDT9600198.1 alpha/beta hydrolase-fold protein [Sphingosinicella sp. GR2756]
MTAILPRQFIEPNVQIFDLAAEANGASYEVRIGLPSTYATGDRSYPLLVMLDADVAFGTVYETMMLNAMWSQAPLERERQPVPEYIVVGISLPDRAEKPFRRNFEYMPGEDGTAAFDLPRRYMERVSQWLGQEIKLGGAPIFQKVLAEEIIPAVEQHYRVSPDGRILLGASAGGSFCCYTLFSRPELFAYYVIVSPGIGSTTIFDLEAAWAESHDDLDAGVYLSAGLDEVGDALMIPSSTIRLAEQLSARRYKSLRLHHMMFPDANHVDTVAPTLARALKTLL